MGVIYKISYFKRWIVFVGGQKCRLIGQIALLFSFSRNASKSVLNFFASNSRSALALGVLAVLVPQLKPQSV